MSNNHQLFNVSKVNGNGDSQQNEQSQPMMDFVGKTADCREHMVNNKFMSDVVFIVGEEKQRIYGHKMFLITASKYFFTMFTGGFKESGASEVTLEDTDPIIFLEILRFVYAHRVTITLENVHDICVVCEKYMFVDILEHASKFLVKSITEETVLKILKLNRRFYFENVDERCLDVITENAMFYFKHEDISLLDRDSLELIVRAKRINCSNAEILNMLNDWQESDEVDVAEMKAKQVAELKTVLDNTPRSLRCNTLRVFGNFNREKICNSTARCIGSNITYRFTVTSKNPIFLVGIGVYVELPQKKLITANLVTYRAKVADVLGSCDFSAEDTATINIANIYFPITKLVPHQHYAIYLEGLQNYFHLEKPMIHHESIVLTIDEEYCPIAYFLYLENVNM
ncbi:BTB/POZ domain-containing protein 19-like [Topomyia yanbarensis]|uniref:BTB/POZ domain-containing protein 19-like n=1 Tax=Topomyia yanbarensis TaxID=2498891 RepID=UPI00273C8832|nr:BTB/POZ domain-containing protein 19-like [Topomyia yanbarensis]